MAKTATKSRRASAGRGGSLTWMMGMACGAILTFATPTAVLGGVLLAPAILVALLDAYPGRATTRAVFVATAGPAFGPIWHLNASGATLGQALDMLCEPAVLCPAWLAGACAWAVCECLPVLLRGAAERLATARAAALSQEADALRAEWDFDGGPP